jgi:hypothetical protein
MYGLNRLRKNSEFWAKLAESVPPRLKPALMLFDLCGGLKPPPPSGSRFSAACLARTLHCGLIG